MTTYRTDLQLDYALYFSKMVKQKFIKFTHVHMSVFYEENLNVWTELSEHIISEFFSYRFLLSTGFNNWLLRDFFDS